ncbi:hypothetical protein HaLaN_06029 [Haematococcus lacustris]|uniref:Uncharacterized protein n=1 Tax=Haematococcus lacustris TaxID=44745 RepID=A0A699YMD2_HAELA|nr:hypothetical protein HaLaN_06029 [Haematococcus lacustris]
MKCETQRWLAPIKPHLQHLAAASSADTSLVANLKHITVTLATWDAVWEVYLDPKLARQRLRLYEAQDRALEQFFKQLTVPCLTWCHHVSHHVRALCAWLQLEKDMAEVSMERHGRAKQLVVFFGAASIGTGGGWGADAVLWACCKVVCRPRGSDQLRGRGVLVDEHRTTRVSSAVNGQQPCEEELDHEQHTRRADWNFQWKPPAGQVDLRPSAASAPRLSRQLSPPSQPRGSARWRLLELRWWPEQSALPGKGKEYPGLGYKRVRDKPPKAQQQQQPAVAQ